jgi:hypothetical protein
MKDDKDNKSKLDQNNPKVFTPEPPQVMNPSEPLKKNTDRDKASKRKKKVKRG